MLFAAIPPGVVTATLMGASRRGGAVATIVVDETMVNVAAVPPNDTDVAPVKFVPVIVTGVPPAVEPELRLRPVTVGARIWNVN